MLPFKPITFQDQTIIEHYLKQSHSHSSDYCFVDAFIWKDQFEIEFCVKKDFLFMKMRSYIDNTPVYGAPAGTGNIADAISCILEDAKERHIPLVMTSVSPDRKTEIETLFPNCFAFNEMRDSEDYIYRSVDLIHLSGRRYHGQKNHINHFLKEYNGRWRYVGMDAGNMKDATAFHSQWLCQHNRQDEPFLQGEDHALCCALEHFQALNLCGGLLYLDRSVIGFSIGMQNTKDMFIIQIEKADRSIPGSYQMINQQFARANCQNVIWINREEDLGIEGLRKAKLSYHPAFMDVKYMATLKHGGD